MFVPYTKCFGQPFVYFSKPFPFKVSFRFLISFLKTIANFFFNIIHLTYLREWNLPSTSSHSSSAYNSQGWARLEPGQSRSPTWMARTQVFETTPAAFQGVYSKEAGFGGYQGLKGQLSDRWFRFPKWQLLYQVPTLSELFWLYQRKLKFLTKKQRNWGS